MFKRCLTAWKRLASSPKDVCVCHADLVSGNLDTCALHPQFIVIEFCVFLHVKDKMDMFEEKLQSYHTHMNETGSLTPVIEQVKELIIVTKGKTTHCHLPSSIHTA